MNSLVFTALIFMFIVTSILLIACIAWGDETTHDVVDDPHHTHYSIPHAHVHGRVIYNAEANLPPSDNDFPAGDYALALLIIVLLLGLGFFLGYHYGRI